MRIRFPAVVVLAGLLAAAGCGLPTDDEPRELSAEAVPFDLLAAPSTTSPARPPGSQTQFANLYFREGERLVPVAKLVSNAGGTQPDPNAVITALLETPGQELDPGVRTAIPPDTRLLGTRLNGGTLTIDLSDDLNGVEGDLLIFAVAQFVYTTAELEPVDEVRFAINGESIAVPDDDGVEQEDPVSPADYLALAPIPN